MSPAVPFDLGPHLTYLGLGMYETSAPCNYIGNDQVIHIPAGMRTDLASVPRLFWPLIPPHGVWERSAVLHDYLCQCLNHWHQRHDNPPPVNSRDADGLFRRVVRECQQARPRRWYWRIWDFVIRWTLWLGVRYGALANPARRAGITRDLPLMVLWTALLAAPIALPAYALTT